MKVRAYMERAALSPAVWLVAILTLVVIGMAIEP